MRAWFFLFLVFPRGRVLCSGFSRVYVAGVCGVLVGFCKFFLIRFDTFKGWFFGRFYFRRVLRGDRVFRVLVGLS